MTGPMIPTIPRRARLWLAGLLAAGLAVRPRLRRWGSTPAERAMELPGDRVAHGHGPPSTMAVSIAAPPSGVWPWLVQMGWDRAGWYSYDRLDNGGRPSADRIEPAWQDLHEGDRLPSSPQRTWFTVAHLEPERSLVLRSSMDLLARPYDPAGRRPRWFTDGRWEFFLDPAGDAETRLIVRTSGSGAPLWLTALGDLVLWQPVHVMMQRRQLARLKQRAEHAWRKGTAARPRRPRG